MEIVTHKLGCMKMLWLRSKISLIMVLFVSKYYEGAKRTASWLSPGLTRLYTLPSLSSAGYKLEF
jgi:hypothetical protein